MKVKHRLWISDGEGKEVNDSPSLGEWLEAVADAAPSAWVRVLSGPSTAQGELDIEVLMSLDDEAAVGAVLLDDAEGFIRGEYSERELV